MIILEGPEGAGKSTFGQQLSKARSMPLVHTGGPIESKRELLERLDNLDIMRKPRKIFDRIPLISELVYAPLQGREPFITRSASVGILKGINPTIYYCRLDSQEDMFNLMLQNKPHKTVEWMEKVQADFGQVIESYDSLMDHLRLQGLRVIHYNWRDVRCAG